MGILNERIALVTGGTRGIGRAIAERFIAEGATVAICGRDADTAQVVAAELGGNAHGYGCDIADSESVDALIKQVTADLGTIYALVNNAGITKDGLLMRMKNDDWDNVLRTNLNGVFYTCRAAARSMLKAREGRIINLTSIVGLHGQAGQANYSAAKAGIIGFTKAYAQEAAPRGITVNAIAPGLVETDMTADFTEEQRAAIVERVPLNRPGNVNDVAGAAAFLAGPDAAYITGQVISVDGGLGM